MRFYPEQATYIFIHILFGFLSGFVLCSEKLAWNGFHFTS